MDCKTARQLMDLCRPSEDDWQAPELVGVAGHLEECPECLDQFRSRQAFDERVATAMRAVSVPAGLRDEIFARLDRARVWRRRRVFAAWTAAAAAVLLAVGLSFALRPSPRHVTLDTTDPKSWGESALAAVEGHDERKSVPVPAATSGAAAVEAWSRHQLAQLRLNSSLPTRLPTSNLSAIWKAPQGDQSLAVFHFNDPRGEVDVLALPHSHFDVRKLSRADQPIYTTQNFVVVAWTEQETTYIAVLRGWSREDWQSLVGRAPGLT